MWSVWGIDGWYFIILAILILIGIYFDIKPRHSAFETTAAILGAAALAIIGIFAIYFIYMVAIWINSNLGLAVFILAIFYALWAIAAYLIKYKKELLINIIGAYLTARIEAFVAGMSIIINTPVGVLTLSIGSITWVGLFDPRIGQLLWTLSLPAYIWITASATLCFGITSLIGGFAKLVEPFIHTAEAWYNKGNTFLNRSKFDKAIECYDKAIRINPKYAEAWNNKGTALNSQSKHDKAIKCYDKAIKINPKYAEAWNNKGAALNALGSTIEANEALAKAKKLGYKV